MSEILITNGSYRINSDNTLIIINGKINDVELDEYLRIKMEYDNLKSRYSHMIDDNVYIVPKLEEDAKLISDLEKKCAGLLKKLTDMEVENDDLKKDIVKLRGENDTLRKDIVKIRDDNIDLKKDIVKTRRENINLRNEVIDLRNDIIDLDKEINKLKKEINRLNSEIDTLKEENKIINDKYDNLTDKYDIVIRNLGKIQLSNIIIDISQLIKILIFINKDQINIFNDKKLDLNFHLDLAEKLKNNKNLSKKFRNDLKIDKDDLSDIIFKLSDITLERNDLVHNHLKSDKIKDMIKMLYEELNNLYIESAINLKFSKTECYSILKLLEFSINNNLYKSE